MNVTKLAWVDAARSLNAKRMIRSAVAIPVSSQTACSARRLYIGRTVVVSVVMLFPLAACICSSLTDERACCLLQMQDVVPKVRHAAVATRCHNAGGFEEGTPELDSPRATSGSTRTRGPLPGAPSDPARAWGRAEGATGPVAADRPRQGAGPLSSKGYGARLRSDRCGDRGRPAYRGLWRLRRGWRHRLCHAGPRAAFGGRRRHHLYPQPLYGRLRPESRGAQRPARARREARHHLRLRDELGGSGRRAATRHAVDRDRPS